MLSEPLEKSLLDISTLLERRGFSYALIGGMAVTFRGQARFTDDVDLVISANVPEALQLAESLEGTPFRPLFDGIAEVVEASFILPLLHRSTNIKLDLALGLSGFDHQVLTRARTVAFSGTTIKVATAEDLLLMKVLAGRPQDEQDVRGLVITQGQHLDWDYCLDVAPALR